MKLIAGIDVSGSPGRGNHSFVAIVICTQDRMSSIIRSLGSEQIHMHEIRGDQTRNEILSRLSFDRSTCAAFCFQIRRDEIVSEIKNMRKSRSSNTQSKRIFTVFNYVLWGVMQDRIKEFLQGHRHDLHDVVFQCDHDSEDFLKTAGLRHSYKGHAYMVSDIVAWANNRGIEPAGVISDNLVPEIKKLLKNKMR